MTATATTTRPATGGPTSANSSKHAFAPFAPSRPRNSTAGNVTLPEQGHNLDLWPVGLASGTSRHDFYVSVGAGSQTAVLVHNEDGPTSPGCDDEPVGVPGPSRVGSPIDGTSGPPIAATMENIGRVASQSGVDLSGLDVQVVDDPALAGKQLYGWTNPDSGLQIQLYPDAFSNEETLATTLGHEYTHVQQIADGGPNLDSDMAIAREREAFALEGRYLAKFRENSG